MKVFISWSGERSEQMAKILREYLPQFIQSIDTWVSSEDIPKGEKWAAELDRQLEDAKLGIVCITSESYDGPWVLFESGALSLRVNVCPILLDFNKSDISGPLANFQLTLFEQNDFFKLIKSINEIQEEKTIPEENLKKTFDKFWPDLVEEMRKIPKDLQQKPKRKERDILEEILSVVRNQERWGTELNFKNMGERELDSLAKGVSKGIFRALDDDSRVRKAFKEGVAEGMKPGIIKALDDDSDVRKSFKEGIIKGSEPGIESALRKDSDVRKSFKEGVIKGSEPGIENALRKDSDVRKSFKEGIIKGSEPGIENALRKDSDMRKSFKEGVIKGSEPGIENALRRDSDVKKSFKEGIIKGSEPGIENALRKDSGVKKAFEKGVSRK